MRTDHVAAKVKRELLTAGFSEQTTADGEVVGAGFLVLASNGVRPSQDSVTVSFYAPKTDNDVDQLTKSILQRYYALLVAKLGVSCSIKLHADGLECPRLSRHVHLSDK